MPRVRNLDIVSEARLIYAFDGIKKDVMRVAALEPILEAVSKTAQEDLSVPRLFDMTVSALRHADSADAEKSPLLCAAYLLKLFAVMGVRPSFHTCVTCGREIPLGSVHHVPAHGEVSAGAGTAEETRRFSFSGGGVVCDQCMLSEPTTAISAQTLVWSDALLHMTFDQVVECNCDLNRTFDILKFCQTWLQTNLAIRSKSLDFLFKSGLF